MSQVSGNSSAYLPNTPRHGGMYLRYVFSLLILIGGWVPPAEFSQMDWFQLVFQADIAEWSAGAPLGSRVASGSSWLLVAPILWPCERTRVIMANSGLYRCTTAVLLSWSTCADVVLLTIKMYQHSFSSFFLLYTIGISTITCRAPYLQLLLLKHHDISDRITSGT